MHLSKLALAALLLPLAAAAAGVSIQAQDGAFKVAGWQATSEPPGGWSSVFNVYAGSGTAADTPPLFGSYSVQNGTLSFRPRFPMAPGVTYRAIFRLPGAEAVEASFHGPEAPAASPSTRVVAVYPSSGVLPSNQLKLYVAFSAPMQRGGFWSKIRLLDESGKPVVLPFVEIEQELWDREYRRITVLFDPGRIKRGVLPNQEMGVVLVEGKRYTLVIDRDLRDSHGLPLVETFRREFRVGAPERRGIDPKRWKITEPKAGTRDPLVIDFDRPLDYALLQHVFDVSGTAGTATIARDETQWRFEPAQPWKSGNHNLVIDMALEDLAGNRIGRPFDVDTVDNPTERITKQTMTLTLRVR